MKDRVQFNPTGNSPEERRERVANETLARHIYNDVVTATKEVDQEELRNRVREIQQKLTSAKLSRNERVFINQLAGIFEPARARNETSPGAKFETGARNVIMVDKSTNSSWIEPNLSNSNANRRLVRTATILAESRAFTPEEKMELMQTFVSAITR